MIINLPPHQQASLDRAWAKRIAAGEAVKAAVAAYRSHPGRFDDPESAILYRNMLQAEAKENRARGVCIRLDFLFRYKPEMDKQA